jgi:hypothetical protein
MPWCIQNYWNTKAQAVRLDTGREQVTKSHMPLGGGMVSPWGLWWDLAARWGKEWWRKWWRGDMRSYCFEKGMGSWARAVAGLQREEGTLEGNFSRR